MLDLELSENRDVPVAATARLVRTWSDDAGTAFAQAFVAAPARWIDWPGLGTFQFVPPSRTVQLFPAADDITRAHDVFARIVQPIILQAMGAEGLHGSAVAGSEGAIVLAGTTGSGKSTLAWTLGQRDGYRQVADDAVVIDRFGHPGGPIVRPLPFRARLRQPSIAALHDHETFSPVTAQPARNEAMPLRAVVVLHQDDLLAETPAVSRLDASEAFTAVLTHAYAFDEHDQAERERMTRDYLALVASVPVLQVRYRPDFASLPSLIDIILAAVGDCQPTHA